MNKLIFRLLFLIMIPACGPASLKPSEYIKWCKEYENGLHRKKEVNGYLFDVQYKPDDMIRATYIGNSQSYNSSSSELQYINLVIDRVDQKSLTGDNKSVSDFNSNQYYFSFEFQNDLFLEENNEKLPCVLFHYERSYDLKSARTFVLGFPKSNSKEIQNKVLLIESEPLNTGPIRIKFDKKSLDNIPELI